METIILLAPLLGSLIGGFGWRAIGETGAMVVTTGLMFLSMLLSWMYFRQVPYHYKYCQDNMHR